MSNDRLVRAWTIVLIALFATSGALWASGIEVQPGPKGMVGSWMAAIWLYVSFNYKPSRQWQKNVMLLGNGLLLFSAIGLWGGLTSYLVTRISPFDFSDPVLYRIDRYIGFDWYFLYGLVEQGSAMSIVMQNLYLSIFYFPTIIIIFLSLHGKDEKLWEFFKIFIASITITLGVFLFFPAKTPLFYTNESVPHYIPAAGIGYFKTILDLRAGNITQIKLHELFGLISFPSFHAASAVVYVYSAWSIRLLRWPMLLLNIGMLLATPIEGAHYLIDIIAGISLALAAIAYVKYAQGRPIRVSELLRRLTAKATHQSETA